MAFLHHKTKGFGKRTLFSKPAGSPRKGALYAFTRGMAPWAKESVMLNLPSYVAGMAFHAGVFSAFGLMCLALLGFELPFFLLVIAQVFTLLGAIGGLSLFVKRIVKAELRGLSCPDDFVSNLLSTAFALLAFLWTLVPSMESLWLAEGALLLIYAPIGKIRHCLFFFTTRYHLGAFFGRRGTFPPEGNSHA